MNILFLSTHLNTGGITSYLFTLAKGLVKRGHSVHVATSGGNMEKDFLSAGIRLLNLNIRTKSELDPRIYAALKPLKQYITENNIEVIHSNTRITQVMGTLLKKKTSCTAVSTCHGFFKTRLSRRIFPCWGDAVIAISQPVQRHLIDDFKIASQKVHLIENGIDLDDFAPVNEEVKLQSRQQYNLGDQPVVGNIARLSDVKGPDILIEAMPEVLKDIPNAKLLLVGEGKMENDLKALVERLSLTEHVRFFSIVSKTPEILPLFDVFVMPSRQEGLGLSIMEAQAVGLPVIASKVGGIPTLIEDRKTGILVEPEDPHLLAEAIVKLINDKQHLKEIGGAGRTFIQEHYSADRMVDQTLECYKKALN